MDPVSMAIGLALQAGGSILGMSASSDYNKQQQKTIGYQQDIEAQKHQLSQLTEQRQSMEVFRNNQRLRAQGLDAATNQGAQFGSGLPGAYGQIRSATGNNLLGLTQNMQIGDNIFGLDANISQDKIAMAKDTQQMQLGNSLGNFGQSVSGASKSIGNLTSGFNPFASNFNRNA